MRAAAIALPILLLTLSTPGHASGFARNTCWTMGAQLGTTSPIGGGVKWVAFGWETSIDLGFMSRCRNKAFRIGMTVQFNSGQFRAQGAALTRLEFAGGIRMHGRLSETLHLGARIAYAIRWVKDGRYPNDINQDGKPVNFHFGMGVNVGPEFWWSIKPWLVLTANIDWLLTPFRKNAFPTTRGQPTHALTARIGVMFVL